ncbi:hypothetical protein SPI_01126 [Niveomyces insectorum RCEF 264]|uniref:ATPase synthesis protein 25 n=1 Tax=Niveomyces insectorum RCEF 264 TaxID=1081102 RepID=A0A162MT89_9HYPO|nr:hypothetical protein SPI_01126 [Niveomyces insectorum RCEF 264]
MLHPTARAASNLACRTQLRCVLQSAPVRQSLDAATRREGGEQGHRGRGRGRQRNQPAQTLLPQHRPRSRWFSTGRALMGKDEQEGRITSSGLEIEVENFFTGAGKRTSKTREDDDGDDGNDITSNSSRPPSNRPASLPSNGSADNVPWYLKVDVPKHAALAPHDSPLPDLPINPPTVLQPLLTFSADDLGLDALTLLDLRALDPPAALGPDLLMLFGTARSERHLHVSADRLVRWLRKYGIHAHADGLLGRNELKIKLRRKARRAKLLGNLGAMMQPGTAVVDDGISTQWVCLTATTTTTKRPSEEGRVVDAEGRVSGFGSADRLGANTTLVVQMLTEAKRQQLDLETLWTRALQRSLQRRADAGEETLELAPSSRAADAASEPAAVSPLAGSATATDATVHLPQQLQQQQSRSFSTSLRRLAVGSDEIAAQLTQPLLSELDLVQLEQQVAGNGGLKVQLLTQLTRYLDSLPRPAALEALGSVGGSGDASAPTTPGQLTRVARYCMRDPPAVDTWAFRSWVHATALRLGHPAYTLAGLGELIREMQAGGLDVPREHFVRLLSGIFAVPRDGLTVESVAALQQEQSDLALRLLDTLYERGQAIIANDILVAVIASLARSSRVIGESAADAAVDELEYDVGDADGRLDDGVPDRVAAAAATGQLQALLEQVQREARLPCPTESDLMVLLDAYATQNSWTRFWQTWRMPPQHGRARSARLYAFLFRRMAETRHQARCIDALRWAVQEMEHEDPPVRPVGGVSEALKACVRVADPQAEILARNLTAAGDAKTAKLANREFVRLLKAVEATNI